MYNDIFDKELIDYLLMYFQSQKVDQLNVTSFIVGDNIYQIRFENEEVVLQFFYEKESNDCEAQIRITNILLNGKMRNKGLSKNLINNLLDYCHNHGDMSLWKEYLVQHGAIVYQEESLLEGAVLLIRDTIN